MTDEPSLAPAPLDPCALVPEYIRLMPYQLRWVEDQSRLKIIEKSRQVGLSAATAFALTRRKAEEGCRLDAWVTSRDDHQARLFLQDCRQFAAVLEQAAPELGYADFETLATTHCLRFPNGCCIHSLSSNVDAQAGKRGDRVLDEFALHPDSRRLYAVAYPGITWGGSLEIISTHRGTGSFFNSLINEIRHQGNPKGFSLHRVTLQDALEQGFLRRLQRKLPPDDPRQAMDDAAYFDFIRAGCPDEESFLQEYCCQPGDDEAAFLPYDLIAGCEYAEGGAWAWTEAEAARSTSPLYLGVDIGRDHDLTVFWLLEAVVDARITRAVICLEQQTFEAQEHALEGWVKLPNLRRCCIDQTGLGRQFVERARRRFGPCKVEGITFTAGVKEALAYPVRSAFEARRLRVPHDARIRSDLRAVRKETTAAGNLRFASDRGRNGHADRFWALALALHAAAQPGGGWRAMAVETGSFRGAQG